MRNKAVQAAEAAEAERALPQLATSWDAVKLGELAALNTALAQADCRRSAPETRQDDGDEESPYGDRQ
jgi:hypothetical protein